MNLESTNLAAQKISTTTIKNEITNSVNSNSSANNTNAANKDGNSFKDELDAKAKSEVTDNKKVENNTTNPTETKNPMQKAEEKEEIEGNSSIVNNDENKDKELFNSMCDLSEKIKSINELKSFKDSSYIAGIEKHFDTFDLCRTINMDKTDAMFFLNLTENQNQNVQGIVNNITNGNNHIQFQDIKTQVTQKTVAVSQTLMDCLNDSMKTNKPFRIDFGNDIAVIMKVDKDGIISANFIPGSSAVENYLRNNIGYLKQNFEEQNLDYNELSYSRQDGKKQKNNNQKQENKES